MASNNKTGIEKLQKYAFGMNPRRCDDILLLADQIKREHVSELHTIEERYNTDLREAREARDIAIKESAEYNNQLSIQDRYDGIMSELDKRLMPPGMEWPRFEDGMQITWDDAPEDITAVCIALDGSCYSLQYDMPDDELMCIYDVSERVKRPGTEVIGADGLPIKVGETVYGTGREQDVYTVVSPFGEIARGRFTVECKDSTGDECMVDPSQLIHTKPDTQERIDDDATMPPRRYYAEKIGHDVDLKDDEEVFTAVALSLLRRQRELDAKTMGGAK